MKLVKCLFILSFFQVTILLSPALSEDSSSKKAINYFPGIEFKDIDNKSHDISSILASGQKVALVFWQTWCPTCLAELPEISEASKKLTKKMKFYGVVSGPNEFVDDKKVRKFVTDKKIAFPQIRDVSSSVSTKYEVTGTPTFVILGKEGKVLYNSNDLPKDWTAF